ncbi:MAG: TolC family protein [Flammeovirgaceae bacterium]
MFRRTLFFLSKTDRWSERVIKLGFAFLWLLTNQLAYGQSTVLENYVQQGLQSNLALKKEGLHIEKSLKALEEARGLFKPQVSFQASYTLAWGGRTIDFPIGDLLNPVYGSLNQLSGTDQFPMIANESIQFLPHKFHETKFRVIQPLFNTDIYYGYKAQQELVSVQQAKQKTYEKELIKEIKTAYYQYLQTHKVTTIYEDTKTLLEEILRVNKSLVANDKATNEVIYGAEYEISKIDQELVHAHKNKELAKAYFNFLLNRDLQEEIELDEQLIAALAIAEVDLNEMESEALKQRDEFDQLQSAVNAQEQLIMMHKRKAMPSLALVGDLGYQGFGYKFDNTQDFALVQFSLTWDIYKGGQNKTTYQKAQLDKSILENQYDELKNQIRLQVKEKYYAYDAAKQVIATSNAALKSAERNYNITKRKHKEGVIPSFQLLDTQTKYTNARLALVIAQYDLLIKKTALERAVGL